MRNLTLISLLFLLISSCYNEEDYLPTELSVDAFIVQMTASSTSIVADGQTYTYISVELPLEAADSRSVISFTTTKGTFENNTKAITQIATLVNDNGINKRIAKVKLISSTHIETAEVTATLFNASKKISINFTNIPYDDLLSLTSVSASILADGVSSTDIIAEQPLEIADSFTSITFTTSTGLFENGTKTITKPSTITLIGGVYKRTAKVKLTAGKIVETALVEAAITGTNKNLNIQFTNAFPETLRITVNSPFIPPGVGNNIVVTVMMNRSVGSASANNQLTSLTIQDSNLINRGTFINKTLISNAAGAVVNTFTMGTEIFPGYLTVKAIGQNSNGAPISDTIQILAL